MYKIIFKPISDIIIATFLFICLLPIFFVLVITLIVSNKGTPFFFQTRPGKNEKLFKIVKFKTMNNNKDKAGNLLPDKYRMTKVGTLIRKLSLDEIPQLLNIIKGDMSLIGPRPLLPEYLPCYNENQRKRHLVKPGITGWAQVNGRNAISWNQKFEYDVWYVNNISFSLDFKILFLTVIKVFKREGISSASSITMEKFTGN